MSFSYRHRPGLSAINCFERDDLDLIDDLIRENSHHHLNLLLRKDVLYQHDHNQEVVLFSVAGFTAIERICTRHSPSPWAPCCLSDW